MMSSQVASHTSSSARALNWVTAAREAHQRHVELIRSTENDLSIEQRDERAAIESGDTDRIVSAQQRVKAISTLLAARRAMLPSFDRAIEQSIVDEEIERQRVELLQHRRDFLASEIHRLKGAIRVAREDLVRDERNLAEMERSLVAFDKALQSGGDR